jgi:hypothetical protein
MHGLVTLLPEPFFTQTADIWQLLKEKHNLTGIYVTPYPHFSWQIAKNYPPEMLQQALAEICSLVQPIRIRTAGLGIFSGPSPVIFIPVVKSRDLLDFHALVWNRLVSVVEGLSPYYNPDNWSPHISLAYADITHHNLGTVMETLAFQTYNWEFAVDNIAFIYEPDGQVGELKFKIEFGKRTNRQLPAAASGIHP